jgi:hypothetical protein
MSLSKRNLLFVYSRLIILPRNLCRTHFHTQIYAYIGTTKLMTPGPSAILINARLVSLSHKSLLLQRPCCKVVDLTTTLLYSNSTHSNQMTDLHTGSHDDSNGFLGTLRKNRTTRWERGRYCKKIEVNRTNFSISSDVCVPAAPAAIRPERWQPRVQFRSSYPEPVTQP